MDTFITIEVWLDQTGEWMRTSTEPRNLTEAMYCVKEDVQGDKLDGSEPRTYRIIETKVAAIWENGDEIAPTEKLRHRGCSL